VAWEERGGRRYYYTARRVGGRVVKEYAGAGEIGALAEMADAMERSWRQVEKAQQRENLARANAGETAIRELDQATALLSRAILVASGFRRHHRGAWRRPRRRRGTA
jgi:hypothetical protein